MPVKCIINLNGNTQTKDASFTLYVDFFEQNESFENKHKALFFWKIWAQITMICSFWYRAVLFDDFSAKLKCHTILKGLERTRLNTFSPYARANSFNSNQAQGNLKVHLWHCIALCIALCTTYVHDIPKCIALQYVWHFCMHDIHIGTYIAKRFGYRLPRNAAFDVDNDDPTQLHLKMRFSVIFPFEFLRQNSNKNMLSIFFCAKIQLKNMFSIFGAKIQIFGLVKPSEWIWFMKQLQHFWHFWWFSNTCQNVLLYLFRDLWVGNFLSLPLLIDFINHKSRRRRRRGNEADFHASLKGTWKTLIKSSYNSKLKSSY